MTAGSAPSGTSTRIASSVDVTKTGRVTYKVSTPSGQTRVGEGGMLHVVGPMSEDGYTGRSVISTFREHARGSAWRSSSTAASSSRMPRRRRAY